MRQFLLEISIAFIMLFHVFLILSLGASSSEFIYIDF